MTHFNHIESELMLVCQLVSQLPSSLLSCPSMTCSATGQRSMVKMNRKREGKGKQFHLTYFVEKEKEKVALAVALALCSCSLPLQSSYSGLGWRPAWPQWTTVSGLSMVNTSTPRLPLYMAKQGGLAIAIDSLVHYISFSERRRREERPQCVVFARVEW